MASMSTSKADYFDVRGIIESLSYEWDRILEKTSPLGMEYRTAYPSVFLSQNQWDIVLTMRKCGRWISTTRFYLDARDKDYVKDCIASTVGAYLAKRTRWLARFTEEIKRLKIPRITRRKPMEIIERETNHRDIDFAFGRNEYILYGHHPNYIVFKDFGWRSFYIGMPYHAYADYVKRYRHLCLFPGIDYDVARDEDRRDVTRLHFVTVRYGCEDYGRDMAEWLAEMIEMM